MVTPTKTQEKPKDEEENYTVILTSIHLVIIYEAHGTYTDAECVFVMWACNRHFWESCRGDSDFSDYIAPIICSK